MSVNNSFNDDVYVTTTTTSGGTWSPSRTEVITTTVNSPAKKAVVQKKTVVTTTKTVKTRRKNSPTKPVYSPNSTSAIRASERVDTEGSEIQNRLERSFNEEEEFNYEGAEVQIPSPNNHTPKSASSSPQKNSSFEFRSSNSFNSRGSNKRVDVLQTDHKSLLNEMVNSPISVSPSGKKKLTNTINKLMMKYAPGGSINLRSAKSLQWLKTLINKLYDYSYALFKRSGDEVLSDNYSTSLILYTILKTKFVYKSVTDLCWLDMMIAVRKHRVQDWEVELFSKFITGEYSLRCFFWFVCSRAMLVLSKRRGTDRFVTHEVNLLEKESLKTLEQELEDEFDFDRYITLQRAVTVICNLANKKIVRTDIFSKNPVDDWNKNRELVYNYMIKRFANEIFANEENVLMISYSTFLGFLLEILLTTIEELFSELVKYLETGSTYSEDDHQDFFNYYSKMLGNKPITADDADQADNYSSDSDEEKIQQEEEERQEEEEEEEEQLKRIEEEESSEDGFEEPSEGESIHSISSRVFEDHTKRRDFDFDRYSTKHDQNIIKEYINTDTNNVFDIAATFVKKFVEEQDQIPEEDEEEAVYEYEEQDTQQQEGTSEGSKKGGFYYFEETITSYSKKKTEENSNNGRLFVTEKSNSGRKSGTSSKKKKKKKNKTSSSSSSKRLMEKKTYREGIEETVNNFFERIDEYIVINSRVSNTKRLVRKDLDIQGIISELIRISHTVYSTSELQKFFERVEDLVEVMLYRLENYEGKHLDVSIYDDFVSLDSFLKGLASDFERFPQTYLDYVDEWRYELASALQKFVEIKKTQIKRDRTLVTKVIEEEEDGYQRDLIPFEGVGEVRDLDVSVYIRELRKMIKAERDNLQMHLDIVNSGGDIYESPLSPKKKVVKKREVIVEEEVFNRRFTETIGGEIERDLEELRKNANLDEFLKQKEERVIRLLDGDREFIEELSSEDPDSFIHGLNVSQASDREEDDI